MATLTANKLKSKIFCDKVSKLRDGSGEFIFRLGYFYTSGQTSDDFVAAIKKQLTDAGLKFTITDSGDHWAAFKGGAPIAKQSHWWVTAAVKEAV